MFLQQKRSYIYFKFTEEEGIEYGPFTIIFTFFHVAGAVI